jgi:hypothetical protein
MKIRLAGLLMILSLACVAHAVDKKPHPAMDPDGAYKNNCMRCHTEVRQRPPRATKTIMMHMREVANLPPDITQAILEYLNGEPPVAAERNTKSQVAASAQAAN